MKDIHINKKGVLIGENLMSWVVLIIILILGITGVWLLIKKLTG